MLRAMRCAAVYLFRTLMNGGDGDIGLNPIALRECWIFAPEGGPNPSTSYEAKAQSSWKESWGSMEYQLACMVGFSHLVGDADVLQLDAFSE
jgi:hypothetical protein